MKASCAPILGRLGHVIVKWDKKSVKKRLFLAWNFINSPIIRKPLGVQSWNLYTMCLLISGLYTPSLGACSHATKILQAGNGQKVDEFETTCLGKRLRTKSRKTKSPNWTKSLMDKIPNGQNSELDEILNGQNPRWTKSTIEPTSTIEKIRINSVLSAAL